MAQTRRLLLALPGSADSLRDDATRPEKGIGRREISHYCSVDQ